jgi:hypothetical protein
MLQVRLSAVAALILGFTVSMSAFAQTHTHKKVFGYQDPETGEFHAITKHGVRPDLTTTSPTTGDFVVNLTVTLKTAVPTGGKVVCTAGYSGTSLNNTTYEGLYYEESTYVFATVTGSTATCKLTIPYSWLIPANTTTVTYENTVSATVGAAIVSDSTTDILSVDGVGVRSTSQDIFSSIKIPASGTTTTETLAFTL